MIGLLVRGAVYLAWTVKYAVQAGRSFIVSFVGLLPLAGLGATESGVDCGVIGVVIIALAFVPIAPELASAILGLRGDCLAGCVVIRANQLSSPAQKRVMSVVRAARDFSFSWPRCRASHSSRILCLKPARASASVQSAIWFFLVRNRVQNFLADSPGCWIM